MPVTFTTELPDASAPSIDNGTADEIVASWTDVTDNGWYRARFQETSDTDWLTALSGRETVTAADATTNWSSGSNATVSTASNPSEDGTSIKAVTDSTATQGSRTTTFSPGTNDDLSNDDRLQFWYYTSHTAGTHSLTLTDGAGTSETVSFAGQVVADEGHLIQITLSSYTTVNLANIASYQWTFDGDGTGIDKTVYVDSVVAGTERVGQMTTSLTVPYLEDGEEYEVQLRTETEDVTGTWSASSSLTTAFPSPTNPSAGNPTKTSIDLTWSESTDNEDGVRVWRAREYDSGWGYWREVADLAPNTTAHTDATVSPGNTYKYYIEAYTEDASSSSNETSAVTTTSSGRARERTRASGWEVKIEHPSGQVLRPRLLDDPQYTPALNDYPRVEIPVPRDEKWQAPAFENAQVSVWKDGRILPIEELVDVQMEPGRTVLKARGGVALTDRVQEEYDDTEAHQAAQTLIRDQTPYTANVDDPATKTQSDTQMQAADTESEFRDHLNAVISDDEPVVLETTATDNGKLKLQQTAFFREGENPDRQSGMQTSSDSQYSGGTEARLLYQGDYVEYDFNIDHRIPAADVGLACLENTTNFPGVSWKLNGIEVDYLTANDSVDGSVLYGWKKHDANPYDGNGWTGGDLLPADNPHTIRVEVTQDYDGNLSWIGIDGALLYDKGNRFGGYGYTWDETAGYKDGPEAYPASHTVEFKDASTAFNVVGGQIDLTIDDTSNQQAVALSNDQGGTWTEAANTASFQTSFASSGSTLRYRVTLSRYGSQTATPSTGVYGQQLNAYILYGDLEDSPVLNGQTYDGQLIDVLNQIADYGNFIWELQRDESGWSVEWTQPGQRTSDTDRSLVEYSVSKSVETTYEKAVVKGASQPVRGEEFTSDYDTWRNLEHGRLVAATDIVRDPSTGETFKRGENKDYVLDRSDGRIKVDSGGAMKDATTYEIDYQYKTQGEYTVADAGSNPDTLVRTIPSLTTNTDCQNAALYLIQRLQEPLWQATVTIPKAAAGRSLVDDLLLEDLPTDGARMEIRDLRQTSREVTLELGSRNSIGDIVNDLQSRLDNVADRV